ncbi:hypothetical protein, partial [Pseudoalteromonas sp. S1731]|uniref:hypothetical protein n=1 Tax=Pseudoalteromonas sp. S1731 TaxID=579515 RepID=UPI001BB27B55
MKFVQPKGNLITARNAKPWGLNNFHEAKLPRPAHAPYLHPCRQQRVYRPYAAPEGQPMFGIYAAVSS